MADMGTLVVGRISGDEDKFIVLIVSTQEGCILESSKGLDEPELPDIPQMDAHLGHILSRHSPYGPPIWVNRDTDETTNGAHRQEVCAFRD